MIDKNKSKKLLGRVYTPRSVVQIILDLSGYVGDFILCRHVIDNSCGNGAFLTEIVERYCAVANPRTLQFELETYIHGIEIDKQECCCCRARLDSVVEKYGLFNVCWDIVCADALNVDKYDGKMDFVLGNPPYVRTHNLEYFADRVRNFRFAQIGMADLYLAFYEIGLRMLSENGILGYITPSSFFRSVAGVPLRKYLVDEKAILKIVDLGHFQVFNAITYSSIVILKKNMREHGIDVYRYDGNLHFIDILWKENYFINNCFYFGKNEELQKLKDILITEKNFDLFRVKNGFATLADDFFIGYDLELGYTIPVVKASIGKWSKCLFPYDLTSGKILPFDQLTSDEKIRSYYFQHETRLKRRSLENIDYWYGFGRSQGIKDVRKNKFAINSLVRNVEDIKLVYAPEGTGVYGGLYILTELPFEILKKILCSSNFIKYISMLGKYKNGGYYTFSSKDIKVYLEYAYQNLIS